MTVLTIGSVTIGEAELAVLKKLAAGELQCDFQSIATNRYVFSSQAVIATASCSLS